MAERKRLLLRLDPDVYDAMARWASDELRSVNAQIEYALRRALAAAGRDHRLADRAPAAPTDEAQINQAQVDHVRLDPGIDGVADADGLDAVGGGWPGGAVRTSADGGAGADDGPA